ncbi:MAG TPA: DUF3060 domain-containing protein [Mycobacterium sp.]|nr:DUF3060 domain-containing protein [Mycobacterium sp.]
MKDDDPEKRIRELERGLADATPTPENAPYTESAPYAGEAPYTGAPTYSGTPTYGFGTPQPRRSGSFSWLLILVVLGVLVPGVVALVVLFVRSNPSGSILGNIPKPVAPNNGPTAVPQGGELRVGGNLETKTIACNDGHLTLYGTGGTYTVTGHCAGLKVGGYNNNVTVDNADTLESTGYSNTVTAHACNNCKLTLSAYGIEFDVTGHAASLTISSYDNKVTVDSVDRINVSGYDNVVTYHSGTPKITDSGRSNTIHRG